MGRRDSNPVTLATVAAATGVSRMTVSNAYNRPDQLSPALREKVLTAARELGYGGPDPLGRTLSRGKTGSIGLVSEQPLTHAFTDPAGVQMLHGVAEGCEQRSLGLWLVPQTPGGDTALVRSALVDGFILYCTRSDDARIDAARERGLPYVLIDFARDRGGPVVGIDDEGGAYAAAKHLLDLGHRSFGIVMPYLSGVSTMADTRGAAGRHVAAARLAGWRRAIDESGLDPKAVPAIGSDDGSRAAGHRAAARLLDRAERPTAILALSDLLALGVLDAAGERGIAVPDRLSVVGFDDIPQAALATPPLTTISQPHRRKGSEAVRLLLDGDDESGVELPVELVVRASTAPTP
jgi:DNA-binding LacI/PurR family transcriptional regulator